MKHVLNVPGLVSPGARAHRVYMRTAPTILLACMICSAGDTLGTWKLNAARSTFTGDARPQSLTVRIQAHARGEVFTLDRIETDGRVTSYSTILYLDDEPRQFRDSACSGIQSSRRLDSQTVELMRMCSSGEWVRLIRHSGSQPKELVLEITECRADGRRVERRLVLEKREERKQ